MKRARPWLRWALGLLVMALAAWLLWRQLQGLSLAEVRNALASLPSSAIALSLLATAVSFACLAMYEGFATQWIAPGKVPRATAWRVGLVAHALANTLGFHPLTAVALRLQSYRAFGIDAARLAKIVAAIGGCVATGVLGILAVAGLWSLWDAGQSALLLVLLPAAIGAGMLLRERLRMLFPRKRMPAHVGRVIGVGLLEMAAAICALAVLLPVGALPGGPAFVFLFVAAMVLGIISHAPGGVGVFEATMLAAAEPAQRAGVLVALLAFRLLSNLRPCALALLVLAAAGMRARFSSTAGTRA
jgi:uncharacterized membrane protein YbhN (UPF0104 family)